MFVFVPVSAKFLLVFVDEVHNKALELWLLLIFLVVALPAASRVLLQFITISNVPAPSAKLCKSLRNVLRVPFFMEKRLGETFFASTKIRLGPSLASSGLLQGV